MRLSAHAGILMNECKVMLSLHRARESLPSSPSMDSGPSHPWGEVCVVRCSLLAAEEEVREALNDLACDERARATRFVFNEDRRRYVVSHYALRQVLGQACGVPGRGVEWGERQYGRPYVKSPFCPVDFNLSHSRDLALLAIGTGLSVGIDIEHIDEAVAEELAPRVLTPAELRCFEAQPERHRAPLFFRWWTAKEAFLKLNGVGLTLDPTEGHAYRCWGQQFYAVGSASPSVLARSR